MKRLLMSAAIAALAVPAFAQDTTAPETVMEDSAQAAEDAASDAADAANQAADAAGDAAADAADATGDAAADAADAAADAADSAGEAADAAADAAAEATDPVMADPAAAEGEMAAEAEMPAEEPVVAPDVAAPAISAANPGMLSSWISGLQIYTTNMPADSEWGVLEGDAIPAEWASIAKVGDIVIDNDNNVIGYIADIGGFLGIGAKKVLLGTEAIKLGHFGNDSVFATNYTKEELEALPEFDDSTVLPLPAVPVADAPMPDPAADPAVDPAAAPADPAADPAAMPAEAEAPASN
ncbi:PRC-barrel domain-containing protein [Paracoccus sp. M683]|uniref:PRC-barrel domain-containing protein n=1 Tax=Paracoccus sp. M683 TaxID=2594268 RepID=UPI00163DCB69|nr:PRC-barrel domain-containing protein [Paracoccus sp. M683]